MAQFRTKLGFRRVFQLLVQSKLPLVGHNLFYDLLFTFNHFVTLAWAHFWERSKFPGAIPDGPTHGHTPPKNPH